MCVTLLHIRSTMLGDTTVELTYKRFAPKVQ